MNRSGDISDSRPLIIGHRGASARVPENTIASFDLAFQEGADGIEFDVRLARDGVPVVIHDPTLLRTALYSGDVASYDSAFLSKLDAGAWFKKKNPTRARSGIELERIPTLEQIYERYGAHLLYVEMKCEDPLHRAGLARAVVELTCKHDLTERVVVKSFEHDSLIEVKGLAPEIRTAALFERKWPRPLLSSSAIIKEAGACGADEISLHHSLLRKATVEAARSNGFEIVVWTVNSSFLLRRAASLKVRAIITDNPRQMKQALMRTKSPRNKVQG